MTMMQFFAFPSITIPISSHTPLCIPLPRNSFERSSLSHRSRTLSVPVHGESPGNSPTPPAPSSSSSCGEDLQALNGVSKPYSSVKRKSIPELSEIIGDECRCICSFLPFFRTFHGKEQLVAFFSFLTKTFGNNIEFTVRPTLQEGMSIGVAWKLEWKKKHTPFGRGFSLDLCQIYQGRITLRNVEMFLEPFLRSEPLKANAVAILMTITEKISGLVLVVLKKGEVKKRAACLMDDESLRRWKEQLLGSVDFNSVGESLDPEVKILSLTIKSPGKSDVFLSILENGKPNGPWFTLKEGSRYSLNFSFQVKINIVAGLKYANTVWKACVKVDSTKEMIGTFSPQLEPYTHEMPEDTTPSGFLAR